MPDNPKIGFTAGQTCFTVNIDGTGLEEMSFLESLGTCIGGEWSPDRRQFATTSPGDWSPGESTVERLGLYVLNLDSGRWQQVLSSYSINGLIWSPDGEFLAFSVTAEDGADVWAYEVQGKRLHQVTHGANAQCPAWLPGE